MQSPATQPTQSDPVQRVPTEEPPRDTSVTDQGTGLLFCPRCGHPLTNETQDVCPACKLRQCPSCG